jgi:hypothetical protein
MLAMAWTLKAFRQGRRASQSFSTALRPLSPLAQLSQLAALVALIESRHATMQIQARSTLDPLGLLQRLAYFAIHLDPMARPQLHLVRRWSHRATRSPVWAVLVLGALVAIVRAVALAVLALGLCVQPPPCWLVLFAWSWLFREDICVLSSERTKVSCRAHSLESPLLGSQEHFPRASALAARADHGEQRRR